MNAAAAGLAVVPIGIRPSGRPLTLPMRTALGYLHTGALFFGGGNIWRCREFSDERVSDRTVRALEDAGFALLQEYEGMHGVRRVAASLTSAGIVAYRSLGGRFARRRPPPFLAEATLYEVEKTVETFGSEEERLQGEIDELGRRSHAARRLITEAESAFRKIDERISRLELQRERLATCQVDIRAIADQAAQRLGEAVSDIP